MEQIVQWIQESLTAFPTIGVADIVDILIMAFIFYKLLMIVRRTSSGQVMKGVLLVVVAFVVVSAFQLRMLSYLMGKVLEWGVLALVILFQPEIRRFLEQMGRSRIGSVFVREETPGELENAITQTVDVYKRQLPYGWAGRLPQRYFAGGQKRRNRYAARPVH